MLKYFIYIYGVIFFIDIVSSISCYKCLSINGSNPVCEDLFQGDMEGKPSLLQTPCLTHIRGRKGVFPATHCIKLVAYSTGPNVARYTYRTCGRDEAEENGITRVSHCGLVKLDWINKHQRFRGCLHICDRDSCNQASSMYSIWTITYYFSIVLFNIIHRFYLD